MAIVIDKYTDLEDGFVRVLREHELNAGFFKDIRTMPLEKLHAGRELFMPHQFPCVYVAVSEGDVTSEPETTRKDRWTIPMVCTGWVSAGEYEHARREARKAVSIIETIAKRQIDAENDFDGWCGYTQSVTPSIDEPNKNTDDGQFTCRFDVIITAWNIYDVDA